MNYIFDTSSAILLFEKCHLRKQLLDFSKISKLYVPSRVFEEFKKGVNVKPTDIDDFKKVFSVVNPTMNNELLSYFNFKDRSGEIWVIAYAIRNPECCCVIDEEFGRNIAIHFELQLTGAMGIIYEMKEQKILSENDLHHLRENIEKSGFYLSKKLLKELDKICSSHQT